MATCNNHVLGELTSVQGTNPIDTYQRPILINSFIKVSFFIDGEIKTQDLASISTIVSATSF